MFTCDLCGYTQDGSSKRYSLGGVRGVACRDCWPVLAALLEEEGIARRLAAQRAPSVAPYLPPYVTNESRFQ